MAEEFGELGGLGGIAGNVQTVTSGDPGTIAIGGTAVNPTVAGGPVVFDFVQVYWR